MVRLLAMPLMLGAAASLAVGLAFQNSPTLAAGALIVGYVLVLAGIMLSRFSRSVAIAAKRPWFFAWPVFASQVLLVATSIPLLVFDVKNVTTWFIAYGLTYSLPSVCSIILSRRGKGAVDAGSGTDRATKKLRRGRDFARQRWPFGQHKLTVCHWLGPPCPGPCVGFAGGLAL